MKRIALFILLGFSFYACDNRVFEPDPVDQPYNPDVKTISLKIHVPSNSLPTYAAEAASPNENVIDSIFVHVYQGGSFLHEDKFKLGDLNNGLTVINDTTLNLAYEVDDITTPPLLVKVFANKRQPAVINSEIVSPTVGTPGTYFYMSGQVGLTPPGTAYTGTVHIERNVAKLRLNVSKNSIYMPSDLEIDYDHISVKVLNAANNTSEFREKDPPGIGYIDYAARTANRGASITNGGKIDSIYLYENYRSNYAGNLPTDGKPTIIEVTIPTMSATEGNRTSTYPYTLHTAMTGDTIFRNYIYTLDIKVQGQSLDPLITMDVLPWNDVPMDGSINGTYLSLDKSEISFDPVTGEIIVNYCTDAQAIYFNFDDFNLANSHNGAKIRGNIQTEGIDTSLVSFPLAPIGFQDAQIIIDQQHCGSFKFKLNPNDFPGFPNIDFSGQICMKAGNIIKCLTFPARNTFDAHFIVGEPIFDGELFTKATCVKTNQKESNWLEVSTQRYYYDLTTGVKTASDAYGVTSSAPEAQLYLHLDENLSGATRSGIVTLVNSNTGVTKAITVTQLPAIPIGRFGYVANATDYISDDSVYNNHLYTEQLHEYTEPVLGLKMPRYTNVTSNTQASRNALYNGRMTTIGNFVFGDYSNNFNYSNALFMAMNYCAQKNRLTLNTVNDSVKWYLPSQAQLMGMWITFESYKAVPTSTFIADIYWSATDNEGYDTQAQYIDFQFGNIGHYERTRTHWARCVRNGTSTSATNTMIQFNSSGNYAWINFGVQSGLPAGSFSLTPKTPFSGDEHALDNRTVYERLRVARADYVSGGTSLWPATQGCGSYAEGIATTGWRLPTQRELQAIWILQDEIAKLYPSSFEKLSQSHYYWSGTYAHYSETNGTNAWVIYGGSGYFQRGGAGNMPHQLMTTPNRIRCVLELP